MVDIECVAARLVEEVQALQWVAGEEPFGISVTTGFASTELLAGATLDQLLDVADRDLYKNKWTRKNPEARPELYEYPAVGRKIDLVLPLRSPLTDLPTPLRQPSRNK